MAPTSPLSPASTEELSISCWHSMLASEVGTVAGESLTWTWSIVIPIFEVA